MSDMDINTIVVGLDGSTGSARAIAWAVGLAELVSAEVIAVHGIGLLARGDDGVPVPTQTIRAEIERRCREDWSEPLRSASGSVASRIEIRDGHPVSVILTVAEEAGADLVVVGSRGVGGFPDLLLGSTSHQLAQHSPIPVVVIPPGIRGTGRTETGR
jgi:nucleotide-binding universal stress UspA family protein